MEFVNKQSFDRVLRKLSERNTLSIDTETTGLYPYNGDRLFSIAIADKETEYYFNFSDYDDIPENVRLGAEELSKFKTLAGLPLIHWYAHNAKYDQHILWQAGIELKGPVSCTKVLSRLQFNEHNSYSLANCGARIGDAKDDKVMAYIKAHNLYTEKTINGVTFKNPQFDRVPFMLIAKYAAQDARLSYKLGEMQTQRVKENLHVLEGQPDVLSTEISLSKVLFEMERDGVQIDMEYVDQAIVSLEDTMEEASAEFEALTGHEYMSSNKLFQTVFESEKDKWTYTEKGNPQFDKEALSGLDNPAAIHILSYKAAKSSIDFFKNFKFYADCQDVLHTTFDSAGTRSGRFSSSNPNLQNLKKASDSLEKWSVRRAIVPRSGYILAMIDFDQIEYRLMLDYAGAMPLIEKVLGGLDVHSATAEVAGCTRKDAKMVNFLTLYGGGVGKLAEALGCSEDEARKIQDSIFNAAPEIAVFIAKVRRAAENRGWIYNWLGRNFYFPKKSLVYKAPNRLIQGGASDVIKLAMVRLHHFLRHKKSRMLLNIHDELVLEIHNTELGILDEVKEIMEGCYTPKALPLTCGIEWSDKSLADKRDYSELGQEARDSIQGENQTPA